MAADSKIEWTEHTFNPWWGCAKVSPGCDHCYAERNSGRFTPGRVLWGVDAERRTFGDVHWNEPKRWDAAAAKAGKRARVFCASMADLFDKNAPAGARERLWNLIAETPNLDWLLLTKRVGNVAKMVPADWLACSWPTNAWLGISIVNQEEAVRDIPKLLDTPAAKRFLSMEPLLGPVDLRSIDVSGDEEILPLGATWLGREEYGPKLDWVIVGGESGPKARPMHPDWARSLRNQCNAAGVPFLFKQWGEWLPYDYLNDEARFSTKDKPWQRDSGTDFERGLVRVGKKAAGRLLDGREWNEVPQ